MNAGITSTLEKIHDSLPKLREESIGDISVYLSEIKSDLDGQEHGIVVVVQQLFSVFGLLDPHMADQGVWKFVSSSALSFAHSVLKFLRDTHQPLFGVEFWSQQDASTIRKQRQALFDALAARQTEHDKNNPAAISYLHRAWGLIAVDGRVLLRQRQDEHAPNQNTFTPIGGQFSSADLTQADLGMGEAEAAAILRGPLAPDKAIEIALQRQLRDKAGLEVGVHYSFEPWRTVSSQARAQSLQEPLRCQMHVHHISLNLEGMFALSKRCSQDPSLSWFTLSELADAKTVDGKMADIHPLIKDYDSVAEWRTVIRGLKPSYTAAYPFSRTLDAITLPLPPVYSLLQGKTGSERQQDLQLNAEEYSLLCSLCMYSKESECTISSEHIEALPFGWLELKDKGLMSIAKQLAVRLRQANCPIVEGYKERYYRVALAPDLIFFDEALFSYSLHPSPDSKTELWLTRARMSTELITLEPRKVQKTLSSGLCAGLQKVEAGVVLEPVIMESFNKGLRRDLGPLCHRLGLRRIVRTVNNKPKIVIAPSLR